MRFFYYFQKILMDVRPQDERESQLCGYYRIKTALGGALDCNVVATRSMLVSMVFGNYYFFGITGNVIKFDASWQGHRQAIFENIGGKSFSFFSYGLLTWFLEKRFRLSVFLNFFLFCWTKVLKVFWSKVPGKFRLCNRSYNKLFARQSNLHCFSSTAFSISIFCFWLE